MFDFSRDVILLHRRRERMKQNLLDASRPMDAVIGLCESAGGPDECLAPTVTNAIKRMKTRIRDTQEWLERDRE
jgi:hypothetical protein